MPPKTKKTKYAEEQAATLNSKQKEMTFSATKKRQMKVALCNPYNVVWPPVKKASATFVLELLEREFQVIELRKESQIMREDRHSEYQDFNRLKRAEKKELLDKLRKERNPDEVNLMSQLVLGFQQVNKCLERDELRLVLATQESKLLVQPLAQLTALRGCPGMAVGGLEARLIDKLGVSKLSVMGFKKKKPGDSDRFDNLVDKIKPKCPQIKIPWLGLEKELLTIKSPSEVEQNDTTGRDEAGNGGSSDESDVDMSASRSDNTRVHGGASTLVSGTIEISNIVGDSSTSQATTSGSSVMVQSNRTLEVDSSRETSDDVRIVTSPVSDKNDTSDSGSVCDYRHLYLYKADTQLKQQVIFTEKRTGKFITAKTDGLDNMDFVSIGETPEPSSKKRKSKNKSKMSPKKLKTSGESKYQDMDIGRIIPNCNRNAKKVKR